MTHRPKAIGYLSDIDGLRAIAVLAVVLFHLEIPGFDGGYVGVDIFFVISGFLISGLLRNRIEQNSFSFSGFYANRVRRLMPAVLATVIATAIISLFILQPQMLKEVAKSGAASVLSLANILFWLQSGYWDANSDLKPLLHMWSLGVEEQFYLLWPALLLSLLRTGKRFYLGGLLVLFCLSLAACVYYTPIDSAAAFYLLPFRVWQFCLGALAVEVWRNSSLTLFYQQVLRSLGLALCAFSIATFADGSGFPGWMALIPSAGAALVLIASDSGEPSPWLSNRPARWLGQVSYSMYLVHWPPIALYRCWTLTDLDAKAQAAIAVLTLILTVALHYGVERRFYHRGGGSAVGWRGTPLKTVIGSLSMVAVLSVVSSQSDRLAVRDVLLSAEEIESYKQRRFSLIRDNCRIDHLGVKRTCKDAVDPLILFIGNSHEPDAFNMLASALPKVSRDNWIRFGTSNGCGELTVAGDWAAATTDICQQRLDALRNATETRGWHTVIYNAHQPMRHTKAPFLQILRTIKRSNPNVHIVVIDGYLATRQDCAALINKTGTSLGCREPAMVEYFAGASPEQEALRSDFAAVADSYLSKVELLCDDGSLDTCLTQSPNGHPMFVDRHHFTLEFAYWAGKQLAEQNPAWLDMVRVASDTADRQ